MELNSHQTFGKTVSSRRKEYLLTLRKFAGEIGISASLVSQIEQDGHIPAREIILKIAKRLDFDRDYLCGLAGTITPKSEEKLAAAAMRDPIFFRTMLGRIGAGR